MTDTIAPLLADTAAVPASHRPPSTRLLPAAGAVAGPLFLGTGLVQGLTRHGFDFSRNAISRLSLGDLGWIQVTAFLLTGALLIAGAVGLHRVLRGGYGGTWVPRLVGVFGASFLFCAFFTADPGGGFPVGDPAAGSGALSPHGTLHMLGGMVGYLALCAAFLLLGRRFAAERRRGWAVGSRLAPAGVLAGFAGSSATVLAFTLGAGLGLLWLTAATARLGASASDS
ncbi:DUF998 domain-containing protein [Streptomyces sp. NPDC047017]|uniref:DUF998 domain-containing protein n=1 Tax=Streptomyces sp. NPDC047017 TaxID=3155024 RepID=UPI003401F9A8